MLPSIFEKHKICLNRTKSLLLVRDYQQNNQDFATEQRFVIWLHPSFFKDNVFHKSLSLPWSSFQPQCSCVVWNKWFEISPYFNFYLRYTKSKVKVQCKYQSFTMKLSYTTHWAYRASLTILIKFSLLYSFFDATHFSL